MTNHARSTLMRTLVAILAVLAIALGSSAVRAQDKTPGQRAIELGEAALAEYEAKRYDAALAGFLEAEALYHTPVFVLYLARANRRLGKLLEAQKRYQDVIDEVLAEPVPEWLAAQDDARREQAELAAAIPTLTVMVKLPRGHATVRVAGEDIPVGTPVPLEPGTYRVEALGAGDRHEEEIKVVEHDRITLRIALGEATVPSPEPAPPPLPPPPRVAAGDGGMSGVFLGGALSLGLGVVGLALAGPITGAMALDKADLAREGCQAEAEGFVCPTANEEHADSAEALSHASTASFVVGGVAATLGLALLIVGVVGEDDASLAMDGRGIGLRF